MPISPSNRYPRVFMSVLFGFGSQASQASARNVVITGYAKRVGLGQATVSDNVVYGPILSVNEAGVKWGYGSEVHQGVAAALDQSADLTLYGVSFPEAGGGAYAEQTFTITNNSVLGGSLLFTIQGDPNYVEVPITAAMTPTQQATAIYNAFAVRRDLCAYCPTVPVAGSVDFRWNHKGARGNLMAIRWVADGITGSTYALALKTTGVTDSDPSTALDAIANLRAAIIVCPDNSISTSVGVPRWVQYVNQRADPLTGLRGIVVWAHSGTLSELTVVTTAVNAHRSAMAWCKKAEDTPIRIAARYAAYIIQGTNLDIAANLINGGRDGVVLRNFRGPVLNSDRITEAEATAALNVGACPIRTYPGQPTVGIVVRPITTRFQAVDGSPDYATLNLNCVLVPDDIADFWEADIPKTYAGWKMEEEDPDNPNEKPAEYVLRPSMFDQYLYDELRSRQAKGQVVRVEKMLAQNAVKSQIHPLNSDRMLVPNIPLQVISWFAQAEMTIRQTTKV